VFEGRDTFAVSYAHVYEPVPPLPPEHARFQPIINKLLAKDPNDRYASANDLIEALKKVRAGASGSAEPATRRVGAVPRGSATGAQQSAPAARKQSDTSAATMVAGPMGAPAPVPDVDGATVVVAKPATRSPTRPTSTPVAHAGDEDHKPNLKKALPRIAMVGGAVVAVAVLGWSLLGGDGGGKSAFPESQATMDAARRLEMQDKLGAARSMINLGNEDNAEDLYITVLEEFDCSSEEARRGLASLNPERLQKIVDGCK
jgi:serine/threonine-protein kinase PpkA